MKIYILGKRLILHVDSEDLLSALYIRSVDRYLSIETSRTKDSLVQNIHSVCSCKNDDSLIYTKTIHLDKQLVESLLTLVMTATKT